MTAMVQLAVCFPCLLEMCNSYYTAGSKDTSLIHWQEIGVYKSFLVSLVPPWTMRWSSPWHCGSNKNVLGFASGEKPWAAASKCFKGSTKYHENQLTMAGQIHKASKKKDAMNKAHTLCGLCGMMLSIKTKPKSYQQNQPSSVISIYVVWCTQFLICISLKLHILIWNEWKYYKLIF